MIKISSVLSIHNRKKLFSKALLGYLWQTMAPQEWEIILVDDMSKEDLKEAYAPYIGKINLTHIVMDHTRHPIFKKRNPNWKEGDAFENWYHTPSLSNNLGFSFAQGRILSICHPEIMHAPNNFEEAYNLLQWKRSYLFGTTYLGTQAMNAQIDAMGDWRKDGFDGMIDALGGAKVPRFTPYELYWYTSFLPRAAVLAIGGVDFEYLNGAAGEDDDFKERVRLAGWDPIHVAGIRGFHQDHSDEKEGHRQRNTEFWEQGLKVNRLTLSERKKHGNFPKPSNSQYDWTARETLQKITVYTVGSEIAYEPQVQVAT